MDTVIDWLDDQPEHTRIGTLAALALVPMALVAAMAFLFPPVVPFVGALAGAALFVAGLGFWHTVLSPDTQDRTDIKARYPLKQRRGIVGAALVVWLILLLLAGATVPSPVIGTVNVAVCLSLYWVWRATPDEAAEALAAWEAAEAAREAEAAEADPAYEDDENR